MNPRIEPWGSGFASPPAWIIEDLRFANFIFKDSFCAIVLRICEDSLDSWNRPNLLKIDWIRDHDTNQIFFNPDLWLTIWIESGFVKQIHVFTNLLYDSRNLTILQFRVRDGAPNFELKQFVVLVQTTDHNTLNSDSYFDPVIKFISQILRREFCSC